MPALNVFNTMREPQRLKREQEIEQADQEEALLLGGAGTSSFALAVLTEGAAASGGTTSAAEPSLDCPGLVWRSGPVCILGSALVFACAAALVKGVERVDPRVSLFQVGMPTPRCRKSGSSTPSCTCICSAQACPMHRYRVST